MTGRKKHRKNWILQLIILVALIVTAWFSIKEMYMQRTYVEIRGQLYLRAEPVDLRALDIGTEEYLQLCEKYPELEILWLVPLCGERVEPEITFYKVPAGADYREFSDMLIWLPKLASVDFSASGFSNDEVLYFMQNHSEIEITAYTVSISGVVFPGDETELVLPYTEEAVGELVEYRELLPSVTAIDFGDAVVAADDVIRLREAFCADVRCKMNFYGVETAWNAETIDFSNIEISDTADLEKAIAAMPDLNHIEMNDCGIPDEEMDELNRKYEDVRIIWTVYITGDLASYPVRTDADNFNVSKYNATSYPGFDDEALAPLRYCTDMVTLDLGHMDFSSLSFCENMTKLRFLICGNTFIKDFHGLENCYEIYYIEAFLTQISDLTPLTDKTSLKHLNLCYCPITGIDQLSQMTWLERLWIKKVSLNAEQITVLMRSLPDTEVVVNNGNDSSVDYAWRHNDAYFEMRDNLGMPYAIAR